MAGTTDTVKAKLTPGEFVIRKEAVDMIGVPMLNKLNDMPEEGGHSAIDSLIQRATLANMKMMDDGGVVQPNYAGGGMVEEKMQGYENGGGVQKSTVQGLLNLLNAKKEDLYEQMPERVSNTSLGQRLIELDPDVDYEMRRPAPVQDAKLSDVDLMNFLNAYGPNEFTRIFGRQDRRLGQVDFNDPESSVPKFIQGYQEGGLTGYENGGSIYGMNRTPEGMMQAVYEMPTDDGNRYYLGESLRPQPSLSTQVARQKAMQRAVNMPEDSISFEMVQQILNPEAAKPEGKKGLMGLLGFENGGPVNQTPEPTADDPLQIDYRMANPKVYQGSTLGVVRQQAGALRDSIDQDTTNKARKALELLKLEGILKGEKVESPGLMPQIPSAADSSRLRDMLEYFKMQTMQNGSRP